MHRHVEVLAYAVALWPLGFGPVAVDVLDLEVELEFVPFVVAAVLHAAFLEDAQQPQIVTIAERNHVVIEWVGGDQRVTVTVHFGECHPQVGVERGLLADPPRP